MSVRAFISGCAGLRLSRSERHFFREADPWGAILFARNIDNPEQVLRLTDELRACTGRADMPVLIDQEGGRVQRLRPPHWPLYPSGSALGLIYQDRPEAGRRAAWLQSRLIALDLRRLGINADCLPVLDVPAPGAHDIIGDRAYSRQAFVVEQLGRAACNGLLAGGVFPIIKHIPGHGRALADSHLQLPRVDAHPALLASSDFFPFWRLADMPVAMTAHIVYSAIDADNPATTSRIVVERVIRGWIGFNGLLLSDDLCMKALQGDMGERARATFAAGCDVALHCSGELDEMDAVAQEAPVLSGASLARADRALAMLGRKEEADEAALRAEFSSLLERAHAGSLS